MDIVAHALWATAAGKVYNRNGRKPLRLRWLAFWTMFPDLFAFAPMVVAGIIARLSGETRIPHVHSIGGLGLYDLSHSFVIFLPIFTAVWLARRRPWWEMLGWALHIAIDIPSHSRYATPFLWPVSDYRFIGIGWWEPRFMVANYTALALVYLLFLLLWLRDRGEPGIVQK